MKNSMSKESENKLHSLKEFRISILKVEQAFGMGGNNVNVGIRNKLVS